MWDLHRRSVCSTAALVVVVMVYLSSWSFFVHRFYPNIGSREKACLAFSGCTALVGIRRTAAKRYEFRITVPSPAIPYEEFRMMVADG